MAFNKQKYMDQVSALLDQVAQDISAPVADGSGTQAPLQTMASDGNPAVFSQAQMDKAVADGGVQSSSVIQDLRAQLADLPNQIDAEANKRVAALKADLKAKYQAMQVAEMESETGFVNELQ